MMRAPILLAALGLLIPYPLMAQEALEVSEELKALWRALARLPGQESRARQIFAEVEDRLAEAPRRRQALTRAKGKLQAELRTVSREERRRKDRLLRGLREVYKRTRGGSVRLLLAGESLPVALKEERFLHRILSAEAARLRPLEPLTEGLAALDRSIALLGETCRGREAMVEEARVRREGRLREIQARRVTLMEGEERLREQAERLEGRRGPYLTRLAEDRVDLCRPFSALGGHLPPPVAGQVIMLVGLTRLDDQWVESRGIDIQARPDRTVKAVAPGRVERAMSALTLGKTVIVDHGEGYLTLTAGLAEILVDQGDHVGWGQPLGRTGKRLIHFEVQGPKGSEDPLAWMRRGRKAHENSNNGGPEPGSATKGTIPDEQ